MCLRVFHAAEGMCCARELDNGAALIHVAPLALCTCRVFPPLFILSSTICIAALLYIGRLVFRCVVFGAYCARKISKPGL